jgi:phosphomannomutase/phosphoglucomutase
MLSPKHLFGTNGIRGLANRELTPEIAIKIGAAIGTFFKKGTLVVGYDARTSGPMLAKAVIAGLNSTGCNVLLTGMVPTPTLQFAVKNHKVAGGVIITASHNPPEYNGIKVIWSDGIEVSHKQELEIEKVFFTDKIRLAEWNAIGETRELPGVIDE